MLADRVLKAFVPTAEVPIVSADSLDHPLGAWLAGRAPSPDTVLLGVPFDRATVVPSRRGSRGGPAAVRQALGDLNCYNLALDIDFSEVLTARDLGNLAIADDEEVGSVHDRLTEVLAALVEAGTVSVTVGGDDSLAYPAARALTRAMRGRIGVIGFDAHLDMRENYGGRINSGSSYRRMIEELGGRLQPANLVEIGINGWFASKAYADYARKSGARIVTANEVYARGIEAVIDEAIAWATEGTDAVYVNFDVDVWDQPYAPGKVMRNPGGLTARDGFLAAWRLGQSPKVRLFALNEVNPERDLSGFTALNGASVLAYFWAGMATRRR